MPGDTSLPRQDSTQRSRGDICLRRKTLRSCSPTPRPQASMLNKALPTEASLQTAHETCDGGRGGRRQAHFMEANLARMASMTEPRSFLTGVGWLA